MSYDMKTFQQATNLLELLFMMIRTINNHESHSTILIRSLITLNLTLDESLSLDVTWRFFLGLTNIIWLVHKIPIWIPYQCHARRAQHLHGVGELVHFNMEVK
ncbi:hypothetical protein ACJX0J_018421 [Zea mays]